MKSKHLIEAELKGIIQVITEHSKELFTLKPFSEKIRTALRDEYIKGLEEIDKQIKPAINISMPSNAHRQLEALYNYVEQNLSDHVNDISTRLRQEVQRGLQNNEDKHRIIQRVKTVFRDDKQVLNRLKVVIRTETNRANTQGRLEAAQQAEQTGIKLKKWLQVAPYQKGVSSPFCNKPSGAACQNCANGKYGSPEKAIPLDKEFILKADNKTVRAHGPPFHPNCRTVLRIERVEDKNDSLG
jgi:hypothetical protein